ncbi:unnamed protein product, partial [Meganyctiphanes norvegica]
MSLGQKIKLLANNGKTDTEENRNEVWDAEWKQLLKHNHELLLKLSSREESCEHNIKPSVQHSAIQTNTPPNMSDSDDIADPKNSMLSFDLDRQMESMINPDPPQNIGINDDKTTLIDPLECVLEDIVEESEDIVEESLGDQKSRTNPRSRMSDQENQEKEQQRLADDRMLSPLRPLTPLSPNSTGASISPLQSESPMPSHEMSLNSTSIKSIHSSKANNHTLGDNEEIMQFRESLNPENINQTQKDSNFGSKFVNQIQTHDFSCTADLPTYRPPTATSYILRSRWVADKNMRSQRSKELTDVLQMIEDEEKKTEDILAQPNYMKVPELKNILERSNTIADVLSQAVEPQPKTYGASEDVSKSSYNPSVYTLPNTEVNQSKSQGEHVSDYRNVYSTGDSLRLSPDFKDSNDASLSMSSFASLSSLSKSSSSSSNSVANTVVAGAAQATQTSPAKTSSASEPSGVLNSSMAAVVGVTQMSNVINSVTSTKHITTGATEMSTSTVSNSVNTVTTASLPVLQVLVEKVFLFSQDLAERWQISGQQEASSNLKVQISEAERLLESICLQEGLKKDPNKSPELHIKCEEKSKKKQEEYEERIQSNLELIRKLLDDKKFLTEQCERLHKDNRISEKKNMDKIKLSEDRHAEEMKNQRERLLKMEQEKRDKWANHKTKMIKESTYRGVETKMKDLIAKNRDEVSQLKADHWEALRNQEEKFTQMMREQEEEQKKKHEQEIEEVCKREREREQQRLNLEVRQSEQLSLSRLEEVRKQQERDITALIEEHHRTQERQRTEHESSLREALKEKDRVKDECDDKIRSLTRIHNEEVISLRQKSESARLEWQEQFSKEQQVAKSQSERELRERLRRQRDKEIERAIKELQHDTNNKALEEQKDIDIKIRNMRERYKSELSELEGSEKAARTRYLEIKSVLAQKEEEIVYLRARLHSQDLELCELQHMFTPGDER